MVPQEAKAAKAAAKAAKDEELANKKRKEQEEAEKKKKKKKRKVRTPGNRPQQHSTHLGFVLLLLGLCQLHDRENLSAVGLSSHLSLLARLA